MSKESGMNYAPVAKPNPVVKKGEFKVAAIGLDHGHIYGQCNGLKEAGADIAYVYDPDPEKVNQFLDSFPEAKVASSKEELLDSNDIQMISSAAIPCDRGPLGLEALRSGKHYLGDKPAFTTLAQLELAREMILKSSKRFFIYYGERLHNEGAMFAGQLIEQGVIGRVIHMSGMGPHRVSPRSRPKWFFEKDKYGGIICDIASHQIEQFLYYTGNKDAKISSSRVANYNHKSTPSFQDFGDLTLTGENGATAHIRVDWFTPDGLDTWGDGRTFLIGTEGYIEIRKYINLGEKDITDNVYLVNKEGTFKYEVAGQVGFKFFGQMILDCLNNTETAMTQDHIFKTMELALLAQYQAEVLEK